MSERLLLDTDVLVEYLRGQPKAVEYVEKIEADLLISTISVAELFAGARDLKEEEALRQFLLAFVVVPVSDTIAELGGLYRRKFGKSHGTGLADALIAASASESGATLLTFNLRHFPMLQAVRWPYRR